MNALETALVVCTAVSYACAFMGLGAIIEILSSSRRRKQI